MAKEKIKKKWAKILAPTEFKNIEIGETPCFDYSSLKGRMLTISLANLIGDMKKQNTQIKLRINEVGEKVAKTELIGYKMVNAYIKRVVKKGKAKVIDSFKCETKDKFKITLKYILITKNKTNKRVLTSLRKQTKEILVGYCKDNSFNKIIFNFTTNYAQRKLKDMLKKIYPISIFEVKDFSRA